MTPMPAKSPPGRTSSIKALRVVAIIRLLEVNMAASDKTVEAIAKVILRHVTPEIARRIIDDLLEVPGNKSFRDTIAKLVAELQRR
jgi:hypothetical protein